jgi:hypothetical protein
VKKEPMRKEEEGRGKKDNPRRFLTYLLVLQEPRLWESRPLDPVLLEYAAGDVLNLFRLHDKLQEEVRDAAAIAASFLSESYSRWLTNR